MFAPVWGHSNKQVPITGFSRVPACEVKCAIIPRTAIVWWGLVQPSQERWICIVDCCMSSATQGCKRRKQVIMRWLIVVGDHGIWFLSLRYCNNAWNWWSEVTLNGIFAWMIHIRSRSSATFWLRCSLSNFFTAFIKLEMIGEEAPPRVIFVEWCVFKWRAGFVVPPVMLYFIEPVYEWVPLLVFRFR